MANFTPSTDEREGMIIFGIIIFYVLLVSFIVFLKVMGRISITAVCVSLLVVTIIYIPRLLIIKKLKQKDIIKISDNSIIVNDQEIDFDDIEGYKVVEGKPQVVFAISNNLVVYKDARFILKLKSVPEPFIFTAVGSEKTQLLKEFFDSIL